MKKFILVSFLLFSAQFVFSQVADCKCNDFFKNDLRDKFEKFDAQNSKSILLKYFLSDQTTRQQMQNDASMEASISTVIKAIPVDIGISGSSNSAGSKYISIYKEAIQNNYISDETLQSISLSSIPNVAFSSYDNCLRTCEKIHNKDGVTLRNVSTQSDLVVLELRFNSSPSGSKISVKDAIYSGGTVIGNKKFDTNTEIIDGQVLYEHIKLRPDEDITVTIAFNEGVESANLSIDNSKYRRSTDAPIGTIVASVLTYGQFLEVNGLNFESDINKTIWVPCDGRTVGTEPGTYGAFAGGVVPDMRGLFMRGVNDMKAFNSTVPSPIQANLNPDNIEAGKTQTDALKAHNHTFKYRTPRDEASNGGGHNHRVADSGTEKSGTTAKFGSNETRPKNMSVFYYIKIR